VIKGCFVGEDAAVARLILMLLIGALSCGRTRGAMAAMQGMTASMASSTEVKKTGVTRKVAGFACDEWVITMGAMMTTTECVTNDLKYP
jgi:hypothetical protein